MIKGNNISLSAWLLWAFDNTECIVTPPLLCERPAQMRRTEKLEEEFSGSVVEQE